MKVLSYNVNGIRAAIKKGFLDWLQAANPDVICIQETKAQKEQLDLQLFEDLGYTYNYWFSAQKKGYSGVAVLSRIKPNQVVYGKEKYKKWKVTWEFYKNEVTLHFLM